MQKIIFLLLSISILFSFSLFSIEIGQYKFHGNNWFGIEFSSIDNDYYKTVYPEGIADGINLHNVFFFQTKVKDYYVTGMGNFILNDEDVTFRKIFFEAADNNKIFNIGDIHPQETELSINNIRIRGLKAEYIHNIDVDKYRYNKMKPIFQSLYKTKTDNVNLPSYYFNKQNITPLIENINLKIFAGYAHTSTIVNKTKDTEDPPDQLFTALRTNFDLKSNNQLGAGFIIADVQDDISGYDYEKGNSYSLDYKKIFNNVFSTTDDFTISAEFSGSNHNANKNDTELSKSDNAYYGELKYNVKNFGINTRYYNYGADFKTFGNPFLQTNKEGILSELNYSLCQIYHFDLFYEAYENDETDTAVYEKTKIINPSIRLNFPEAPDWFISYQTTDITGDNNNDISSKTDYNYGVKFNISQINFNLNYTTTDYDDYESLSNSYKSNGYSASANYSLLNNRLNIFHYFYTDKFDYESDSETQNTFITFNGSYQLIPDKISLNTIVEFRSSKTDNKSTSDILSNEINLDYIIDYSKQLLFKLRYSDEDYKNEDLNNKILAGKIEYRINF